MGVIDRSGENLIGTDSGVVKCRTMKRNAQKWDIGAVNDMQGVPWESEPDRTNVQIGIKVREWKKREVDADQVLPAEVKETRRVNKFSILLRDVDEHGVTVGCKGCLQSKLEEFDKRGNKIVMSHNEECREKFRDIFEK